MSDGVRTALPIVRMIVEPVYAGEPVFVEGRFVGTHCGAPFTPTGSITASGTRSRSASPTTTSQRTYRDQLDMMTQLAVM